MKTIAGSGVKVMKRGRPEGDKSAAFLPLKGRWRYRPGGRKIIIQTYRRMAACKRRPNLRTKQILYENSSKKLDAMRFSLECGHSMTVSGWNAYRNPSWVPGCFSLCVNEP